MEQAEPLAAETPAADAEQYEKVLGELPSFPPLAMRLAELAGREDASVEEVVDLLRSDAAFSAELLRRANSPAYGFASRIDTLQQALVVLGFDELRRIAMAAAARGYAGPAMQAPELRLCWRHSLAVALLAEELARGTEVTPERAYTAGVMHDIGRLGLLTACPERFAELLQEAEYAGAIEDSSYFLEREADAFGFDHTEAGRWLAERWEIPVDLQAVVGRHHDRPAAAEFDLLTVIQYAVLLADALGFGVTSGVTQRRPAEMAPDAPEEIRPVLQRNPDELAQLLSTRIDALDGNTPEKQTEPAQEASAAPPEPAESDEAETPEPEDAARKLLPWAIGAVAALAAGLGCLMLSS